MGLSSSMWTSVSGLLAHGEKMNVIGNNLSNVSTVGFKSQRMDFEDFIYQDKFSAGGTTQVGLGTGINAVIGDFSQGSFESTNSATDLAIGGNGFFQVRDEHSDEMYYTRAGNFEFDKEGVLTLPGGEILQGWRIDNSEAPLVATGAAPVVTETAPIRGSGVPQDIVLDTFTIPPKQTTKVSFSMNLTSDDGNDKSVDANNPLFAMSSKWIGSEDNRPDGTPPIAADAYAEPSSITVYDEGGGEHILTVYYDQITFPEDTATEEYETNLPAGYKMYEYMVTMDPTEDMRTYGGTINPTTGVLEGGSDFKDTDAAGILMKGTIVFDASGQMINQTAYTYMGNTDYNLDETAGSGAATAADLGHPDNDGSWQPTAVSNNGYPVFTANFSGNPLANSVRQEATTGEDALNYLIEFDLGMKATGSLNDPWGIGAPVAAGDPSVSIVQGKDAAGNLVNVYSQVTDPGTGITTTTYDTTLLADLTANEKEADAVTNRAGSSITYAAVQDGYTSGSLTNVNIDQDGILTGYYSNGRNIPLWQITMYDFMNPQGLSREGGNLYASTLESGNPQVGPAQQGGMGEIISYNLEQSNVDMTREFVQMISTQRGFQANSKGITTVDTMLEQVINMKR